MSCITWAPCTAYIYFNHVQANCIDQDGGSRCDPIPLSDMIDRILCTNGMCHLQFISARQSWRCPSLPRHTTRPRLSSGHSSSGCAGGWRVHVHRKHRSGGRAPVLPRWCSPEITKKWGNYTSIECNVKQLSRDHLIHNYRVKQKSCVEKKRKNLFSKKILLDLKLNRLMLHAICPYKWTNRAGPTNLGRIER